MALLDALRELYAFFALIQAHEVIDEVFFFDLLFFLWRIYFLYLLGKAFWCGFCGFFDGAAEVGGVWNGRGGRGRDVALFEVQQKIGIALAGVGKISALKISLMMEEAGVVGSRL